MAGEKLLIVDDEAMILEYCRSALLDAGYEVVTAGDGQRAVELARTETFALLVTDIKMPGMDGLSTFRAIRQVQPEIAGMIITGYGSLENAVQALQLGFGWFLTKPFTVDELVSAVNYALERRRLVGENARLKALVNLHELAQATARDTDLDALLTTTVRVALSDSGADAGSLALMDEASRSLVPRAAVPPQWGEADEARRADGFMASQAAQMGTARVFLSEGAESPVAAQLMRAAGVSASVCLPLMSGGQVIGTLALHKHQREGAMSFSEADVQSVGLICAHAAIAIANAWLRQWIGQQAGRARPSTPAP